MGAPAKVNLTLRVHGKRPDGYHELSSLVMFSDYQDTLSVVAGPAGSVSLDGPFAHALAHDSISDNLVSRALVCWATATGLPLADLPALKLTKQLPVAAGIGGGSSDAAAALLVCQDLFPELALPPARLHALAAQLGADVPVCVGLHPGARLPTLMTGTGAALEPANVTCAVPVVLVNPGIETPTGPIFKALNAAPLALATGHDPAAQATTYKADTVPGLVKQIGPIGNDLEHPALSLMPQLAGVRDALSATDALLVRMSGSGATWFGIFAAQDAANEAGALLADAHPNWWVAPTVLCRRS